MSESAGAVSAGRGSRAPRGMRWIQGGTFRMGADDAYPEEAPARRVTVGGFWMDEHTVTNDEFAAFVDATGYHTNSA